MNNCGCNTNTAMVTVFFIASIVLCISTAVPFIRGLHDAYSYTSLILSIVLFFTTVFFYTQNMNCSCDPTIESFGFPQVQTLKIPDANKTPIVLPIPTYAPEEYPIPLDMGYNVTALSQEPIYDYYPASDQVSKANNIDQGVYDVITPLNIIPSDEKYIRKQFDGSKKTAVSAMFNKITRNDLQSRYEFSKDYVSQVNRRTSHNNYYDYLAGYQG